MKRGAEYHEPVFPFETIGRLPELGDNAAIALRTLPAGLNYSFHGTVYSIGHTVLEGHRFALQEIAPGKPLLSWGLPFGMALRAIQPGEYLCNDKILRALRGRSISFTLPAIANFQDYRLPASLDPSFFIPGEQVPRHPEPSFFQGYFRNPSRGSGTRNYIVILGTSSRSGPFCRELAEKLNQKIFKGERKDGREGSLWQNLDGIVPVAHTEGGGPDKPNNYERTLRTLAGFITNPNVGAVLAVDLGTEPVNNRELAHYLEQNGYPVEGLLHRFYSIGKEIDKAFSECAAMVEQWIPIVSKYPSEARPVSELKLGLQCGGSDAFSGISGNPLLGIMARETVAHGGSASLAETSELIGAESYVISNVRDFQTARAFLDTLDRFQEWAGWHGHSAEGNPSGGNMFRGLYNIAIKSIGAARKKDPAVRLDYVIGFGDPMPEPGFYFMDSPGNDLESIAGQVASGCNLILFATGNGSITNFPFVPTIKIMTTTTRFELVRREMDINAGTYLEGRPLETLGKESFEKMIEVASGTQSAGERAGHSQVQLWREWRQTGAVGRLPQSGLRDGNPLLGSADFPAGTGVGWTMPKVSPRIGLIVPTSLCAGEIARMIARQLNKMQGSNTSGGLQHVALAHTEGCGNSAGESEALFMRTMVGYIGQPLVARTLLLEHGCEKTHHDAYRAALETAKVPTTQLGWASVQMDGGIEAVSQKVVGWFAGKAAHIPNSGVPLRLGLMITETVPLGIQAALRGLIQKLIVGGASVIMPQCSAQWLDLGAMLTDHNVGVITSDPSLAYGQMVLDDGLHVMESPSRDFLENITGLGGCGATVMLSISAYDFFPGHPFIPLIQASWETTHKLAADFDLLLPGNNPGDCTAKLSHLLREAFAGTYLPQNARRELTAFQVTRGHTGISL